MVDMRVSVAEVERMIVNAVQQGWSAARYYPNAVNMHVDITWNDRRKPFVQVTVK